MKINDFKEVKSILEKYSIDINVGKYDEDTIFRTLTTVFNLGYEKGEKDTHDNYKLGVFS
jgi:hypothetical protein